MYRARTALCAGLLTGLLSLAAAVTASIGDADALSELQPEPNQVKASQLATNLLTQYHYKDTELDDELSVEILTAYLERLDPNRMFFNAKDIEEFQRYRTRFDDSLRESDLAPAFDIYNRFRKRARERLTHAKELVHGDFDFSVDESYRIDRSEADWAASNQELDELWRKRVKNDIINLKLSDKPADEIASTLTERYETLAERIAERDSEDVFGTFMNAFASTIEPHTTYMPPRRAENFRIAMKLSLEGIGAVLQRERDFTEVRSVVTGGPADKQGVLAQGDRIVGVGQGDDGAIQDVVGWRLDDVVELIRGPKGTTVRLRIIPSDVGVDGPRKTIAIERNKVELEEQAAQKRLLEVERGDDSLRLGVISIPTFYLDFKARARNEEDYRSTTRDVRRLIEELEKQDIDGLVVDLRDNGGGSLIEATSLTGLFIDEGPVVQVRDSRGEVEVQKDPHPGTVYQGPLAVLVNRYSASASEIFAGAIQDYRRGVVIGEPTYGKGTVQNLIDLDRFAPGDKTKLGQLKLTTAQFFRVDGASTQHRGVVPDIVFPTMADDDDHGESSLDHALPWTEIDPAQHGRYPAMDKLLGEVEDRHEARLAGNREFNYLLDDLKDYRRRREENTVSLVLSERKAKREAEEQEREARESERQARHIDVIELEGPADDDTPATASAEEIAEGDHPLEAEDPADESPDGADAGDEAEDDRQPDVLLNETARILADLVGMSDGHRVTMRTPEETVGKETADN